MKGPSCAVAVWLTGCPLDPVQTYRTCFWCTGLLRLEFCSDGFHGLTQNDGTRVRPWNLFWLALSPDSAKGGVSRGLRVCEPPEACRAWVL